MSFYHQHAFFCCNQKENGKKCCDNANATELFEYARSRVKEEGLTARNAVRINQSGCLGKCALGPCIVIYPAGRWYTYHSKGDIDAIIESEFIEGNPYSPLLLEEGYL